jgi:mannitol/fructose-specific phosphotransferase system IIA component (Ntr-type)/galactitol-specific phosphotransferase system IIB component
LKVKGIDIIKKPRLGVKINITENNKETLLIEIRELKAHHLVLGKNERVQLLLLRILISEEPQTRDKLLENLGVSRTSVYRDLTAAREWLENNGLSIKTGRKEDIDVFGSEQNWRKSLVRLLLDNLSQDLLVEACVFSTPPSLARKAINQPFIQEAYEYLQKLNLKTVEGLISVLEGKLKVIFTDQSHIYLCLSLAIMLYRISTGKFVSENIESSHEYLPTEDIRVIQKLIKRAETLTNTSLPIEEKHFLVDIINETLDIGYLHEDQPREIKRPETDLALILVREAAKYLHAGLLHDRELIDSLALELSSHDVKSSEQVHSTDIIHGDKDNDLDSLYGFSYRLLSPILEKNGVIPTHTLLEACAIYIDTALNKLGRSRPRRKVWLICGAGIATAHNMASRLNLNLPDLQILGVSSVFELARTPKLTAGADAVISTVHVPGLIDIPLIHVNPLLTLDDIAKIKNTLGLETSTAAISKYPESPPQGFSLQEILRPESIDIDVSVKDWGEAVEVAGKMLHEIGAIWPSYIEAMKEMILLYGPYMVVAPGAALLHAGPEMGGKQLAMCLVTLHKPVPFGHEVHDPVQLVLAFSSIDQTTHVRSVGEAMRLLESKKSRQSIIKARNPEKILKIIHEVSIS